MKAGMQLFDEQGKLVWDLNDSSCRTIGYVRLGGSNNSGILPIKITKGLTPWCYTIIEDNNYVQAKIINGFGNGKFVPLVHIDPIPHELAVKFGYPEGTGALLTWYIDYPNLSSCVNLTIVFGEF